MPRHSSQVICDLLFLVVTIRSRNGSSVREDVGLLAQQLGRGVHGGTARRRRLPRN